MRACEEVQGTFALTIESRGFDSRVSNFNSDCGRYDVAIEHFQRALAITTTALGEDHPSVADTLNNLGSAHNSKGAYDVAIDFHTRLKSGYLAWRSRAPRRIGLGMRSGTEANFLFSNERVTLEDPWESRVMRFARLLAPLGLNPGADDLTLVLYGDVPLTRPESLKALVGAAAGGK